MLVRFPESRRPRRPVRLMIQACPLCGCAIRQESEDGCKTGRCFRTVDPGSFEETVIEQNRHVLRGDLLDVEFSLQALDAAIDLARERAQPFGTYIEQKIPLIYHRTLLRGYVGGLS